MQWRHTHAVLTYWFLVTTRQFCFSHLQIEVEIYGLIEFGIAMKCTIHQLLMVQSELWYAGDGSTWRTNRYTFTAIDTRIS